MNIEKYVAKGKVRYRLLGAYIGVDVVTGKQVRANIKNKVSKSEVKRAYGLKLREFEENGFTVKKQESKVKAKTVNDLIDLFYPHYKNTGIKESAYTTSTQRIDKHIRPYFGDLRLDRLQPMILQPIVDKYCDEVSQTNNHYKTILSSFKRVLTYGVKIDLLDFNPIDKIFIKNVKIEKEEKVKFYEKSELNKILTHVAGFSKQSYSEQASALYIRLLLFTGLRASEGLGLDWLDVDFENKTLSINRGLNNRSEITTLKNKGSYRTIDLDDDSIQDLKEFRELQLAFVSEFGLTVPTMIFYNPKKRKSINPHYHYSSMQRGFQDICKDCGVVYLGLHALRHTHATMLVASGTDYKTIQERMGHDKLEITQDTYSHAIREKKVDAVNNLVEFVKRV
ncbi:MAG: site-specific integrase [Defluviitaleaceae bacterium]|nr:site-specific integrase [Defluviitaleaceae bacterium]